MSTPVNLNRFRKQKARAEKAARANENAAKFGRSKHSRLQEQSASEKADKHLDGHKREIETSTKLDE